MTEQTDQTEEQLSVLAEKALALGSAVRVARFRMQRTRKNIRACRETCKNTNALIGEMNVRAQKHK